MKLYPVEIEITQFNLLPFFTRIIYAEERNEILKSREEKWETIFSRRKTSLAEWNEEGNLSIASPNKSLLFRDLKLYFPREIHFSRCVQSLPSLLSSGKTNMCDWKWGKFIAYVCGNHFAIASSHDGKQREHKEAT